MMWRCSPGGNSWPACYMSKESVAPAYEKFPLTEIQKRQNSRFCLRMGVLFFLFFVFPGDVKGYRGILIIVLMNLFDFLIKSIKFRRVKKIPQRNSQPITKLFNRYHRNVSADRIQHAVYRGRCNPGKCGQFIRPDVPLSAQLLKTFCYYILDIHNVITKKF